MSEEGTPLKRRFSHLRVSLEPNTITFPSGLRAAIPDLPTYSGRVLELGAAEIHCTKGRASHHVDVRLEARETGNLDGAFTVRVDLDWKAALSLAIALRTAAEEAERAGKP